jgi:hypothetical protein
MSSKKKTSKKATIKKVAILDQGGKALEPSQERQLRALPGQMSNQRPEQQAMGMISAAVAGGRSVEEIDRLIGFKERLEKDLATKAYNQAMAAFQKVCPAIPKTGRAQISTKSGGRYEYTFPKLDVIMMQVRPHLAANGLSVTFSDFELQDGFIALSCLIRHEAGHIESHPIRMPIDRSLSINDMQKVGVANSYARRYAVINALNLVGTDEDMDAHDIEVEKVSDEQLVILKEWIEETGANVPKILDFFNASALELLPARRFNEALNMLKERAKLLERQALAEED